MAGDAVVGALRVVLGMDTATYEDGAKRAAKATESFGKRMLEIAGGIQLQKVLESSARALVNFGKSALDTADGLNKLAQKTGIPVEQLSGLKHAAELSDVSVESLARGFKNLSIEITKAQSGSITPASAAFQSLGLDITKFGGDANKAFLALAERISGFDDGMAKTSVTAAIFGKRFGPELIPLLNQGRKGIEATLAAAQKLGLIVSTETARQAEEFNDRLKDLKSVMAGIALTALEPLAAGLARVANSMVDLVNRTDLVKKAAEVLVRGITFVTDNLRVLDTVLGFFLGKLVIQTIINFATGMVLFARAVATAGLAMTLMNATALISVARLGLIAGIIALATGSLPSFTAAMEKVGDTIAKALPPDTAKMITDGLEAIGVKTKSLTADMEALGGSDGTIEAVISAWEGLAKKSKLTFDPDASKRLQDFNNELRKIKLETRELSGEFTGSLAPGFIAAATGLKLINEDGSNLEAILGLTTERARQLNVALLGVAGAKLTEEFLTPWQIYEQTLARINLLLANQKITADVAVNASMKAALALAKSWGESAQAIVSPMADAFKTLASMNKKYAAAAKAAAIGEALVNTFVAATKALTLGPIVGPIAAAAVTAAGLANVAKISATEFAQGGSFKIGGAGGIDSQLVQFKGTPGEMVDVRTPGQQRGGSTEITVRGMGPDEMFTGRWLRGFVEALNRGERDGYRLVFAER